MQRRIKVEGGEDFVYQATNRLPEGEVSVFLDIIQDLQKMSQIQVSYLRKAIGKSNPFLCQMLNKFLAVELAKIQSLEAISTDLTGILKEFIIAKYGTKGGEA